MKKDQIFSQTENYLKELGITALSSDMTRPWGGFFVIDPKNLESFINHFFNSEVKLSQNNRLTMSPKVLIVEPDKRLSWQYHHRRSEIWSVIEGPVGVIRSDDDDQGDLIVLYKKDQIKLRNGERHRLVGLNNWGIIAEIWNHSDPDNPSDEDDIIRLEDDFGR